MTKNEEMLKKIGGYFEKCTYIFQITVGTFGHDISV